MKTYLIEFTLSDGTKEEVELTTDRLEWSIQQWGRNRNVVDHKVIIRRFQPILNKCYLDNYLLI